MAKGIPVTEDTVRAAFREAGYEDVEIRIISQKKRSRSASSRIQYRLPDGISGVIQPGNDTLPDNAPQRIAKIRGDVRRNLRVHGR